MCSCVATLVFPLRLINSFQVFHLHFFPPCICTRFYGLCLQASTFWLFSYGTRFTDDVILQTLWVKINCFWSPKLNMSTLISSEGFFLKKTYQCCLYFQIKQSRLLSLSPRTDWGNPQILMQRNLTSLSALQPLSSCDNDFEVFVEKYSRVVIQSLGKIFTVGVLYVILFYIRLHKTAKKLFGADVYNISLV